MIAETVPPTGRFHFPNVCLSSWFCVP